MKRAGACQTCNKPVRIDRLLCPGCRQAESRKKPTPERLCIRCGRPCRACDACYRCRVAKFADYHDRRVRPEGWDAWLEVLSLRAEFRLPLDADILDLSRLTPADRAALREGCRCEQPFLWGEGVAA